MHNQLKSADLYLQVCSAGVLKPAGFCRILKIDSVGLRIVLSCNSIGITFEGCDVSVQNLRQNSVLAYRSWWFWGSCSINREAKPSAVGLREYSSFL